MKTEEKPGDAGAVKAAGKAIARPPQDRAMPEPAPRSPGPDPTRRRPNSLSRSILPLVLFLLVVGLRPFRAATVTGSLVDLNLNGLQTPLTFFPTNLVLVTSSGALSGGPAITITATNGNFTNRLDAGDYVVSLPKVPWRKAFTITVPPGTNSYNITNLMTALITYTNALADDASTTLLFEE